MMTKPHSSAQRRLTVVAGALTFSLVSLVSYGVGAEEAATVAKAPEVRTPGPNGQISKYRIEEEEPTRYLPSLAEMRKEPLEYGYLLMDLSVVADRAFEKKDYARAARYYEALTVVVPEKSTPYSQLCASYAHQQKMTEALVACRDALHRDGTQLRDYQRFLALLIESRSRPTPEDVRQADLVFAHLAAQRIEEPIFFKLACDLALKLEDKKRLQACTQALAKVAPSEGTTITYRWSLALMQKDAVAAFGLIERAKAAGVRPEGIRRMQSATAAMGKRAKQSRVVLAVVLIVGALIGAFAIARQLLRQRPVTPSSA